MNQKEQTTDKSFANKEALKIKIDYLKSRLDHTLTHLQTASKMIYLIDGGVLAFAYFLVNRFGLSRGIAIILAAVSVILAGVNFLHSRFILTQQHWYRELDIQMRNLLNVEDLTQYEQSKFKIDWFAKKFNREWFTSSHRNLKYIHIWIAIWLILTTLILSLYGFGYFPEKLLPFFSH